jgi:hypothetical protein
VPSSTRPYDRSAGYGRMRASRRGVTGPRLLCDPRLCGRTEANAGGHDRTSNLRAIHFGITGWRVYALAEWRIRLAPVRQLCRRGPSIEKYLACITTTLLAGSALAQGSTVLSVRCVHLRTGSPHQTCSNMSVVVGRAERGEEQREHQDGGRPAFPALEE